MADNSISRQRAQQQIGGASPVIGPILGWFADLVISLRTAVDNGGEQNFKPLRGVQGLGRTLNASLPHQALEQGQSFVFHERQNRLP